MRIQFLLLTLGLFISLSTYASVPTVAYSFDFNVDLINVPKVKENKILDAMNLVKKVFSSAEFKNKVLGHRFNRRFGFAHSGGLSNTQIYYKILAGAERLNRIKNNSMDLEVELYRDMQSMTVGYTRTLSPRIWMNTKFFDKFSASGVAGNLVHEWLHKLGFQHDVRKTFRRKYSVPYAVGKIVRKIAARYEKSL